jgi:hypothetical protein
VTVVVSAPGWAQRWFAIVAQLPFGQDAATLYPLPKALADGVLVTPLTPERASALLEFYLGAHGRLSLQFGPLWVDDDATCERLLEEGVLKALSNNTGRKLLSCFKLAWEETSVVAPVVPECTSLVERLGELRAALWGTAVPPSLSLWHCSALGPHARAVSRRGGARVVAADLTQPLALIQVFHEECHPRSDPTAVDSALHRHRETRVGTPGFSVHAALERAAVELGDRILEEHAPDLLSDYMMWKVRHAMA